MSEAFKDLILGVVQGLTEFLPVSSSGHLALLQHYLGIEGDRLFFDVMLHFATLLAVVIYFRREVLSYVRQPKVLLLIALVSVPTGVVGLSLKGLVERILTDPKPVAFAFFVTALLVFVVDRVEGKGTLAELGAFGALLIGVFQGLAVIPGISRSGSTIFASILTGLKREEAAPFSFIVSIPAIAGATLLELKDAKGLSFHQGYILGMLAAFLTGLLALKLFMETLKRRRFTIFSGYLVLLGIAVLLLS